MLDTEERLERMRSCVERIGSVLRCYLCGGMLENPYRVVTCNHSFCGECARKELEDHSRCPACGLPAYPRDIVQNKHLRNLLTSFSRLREESERILEIAQANTTVQKANEPDAQKKAEREAESVSLAINDQREKKVTAPGVEWDSQKENKCIIDSKKPIVRRPEEKRKRHRWRQETLILSQDGSLRSTRSGYSQEDSKQINAGQAETSDLPCQKDGEKMGISNQLPPETPSPSSQPNSTQSPAEITIPVPSQGDSASTQPPEENNRESSRLQVRNPLLAQLPEDKKNGD